MFLANLTKREKTLFYLAIIIISTSLVYNFMLKSLTEKWSQLNRQILNKEIELKKNIRLLKQKNQVKRIYQKYAGYVKRAGTDEEEMASLLNAVENAASLSGMHIANIRPRPIKDLEFYKKYILEMNCEASMEDYIEFIYNLQKSGQLIRVEKLKMTSQGKDDPLLKARLLITKVLTAD